MIYKCVACDTKFSVCICNDNGTGDMAYDVKKHKLVDSVCPKCSLAWFRRLAKGERPEWVTRGKK